MKPYLHTVSFFVLLLLASQSVQSQSADEWVDKGQQKMQNGHYNEALLDYNEAVKVDPEHLDAYLKRAFVHAMLKDYEQAIADYTKILELNPNLVLAYLSRGSAFNKLELFEKAMVDFNKALELDPENSEAYNNRGWSKKGLGDKDGACDDWKTSKKMGNNEAKIILKNNQC